MDNNYIHRWNGEYFGFVSSDRLFDARGHYLGWIDENNQVWRANGTYLGEIVDDNYILRNQSRATPMNRIARIPPIPPVQRTPAMNRVGRVGRMGWVDALEQFD